MAYSSPAFSNWPSPMNHEKNPHQQAAYHPLPSQHNLDNDNHAFPYESPSQLLLNKNASATSTSLARIERLKRYNAIFGYTLNLLSVGLTMAMEAIMAYVLYKYYTTKDIAAPGRTSPWAADTQLWPAFTLLAGSVVTFIIDLVSIIAACCHKSKRARKLEDGLGYVAYGFYVVKWVVVATLYLVGKTSKDLWGWSCDVRAAEIQEFYKTDLDFSRLCMEQTVASYLSWAEGVLKVVLFVAALWLTIKARVLNRRG